MIDACLGPLIVACTVAPLAACGGGNGDGAGADGGNGNRADAGGNGGGACGAVSLAAAPTAVALPSGYAPNAFVTVAASPACGAAGTPTYTLLDVVGDAALDLVVTRVCGDDTVGATHWRAHAGGASFGDPGADFALPSGYAGGFLAPAAAPACGAATTPTYSVFDVTGDGSPDLVITRVCGDDAVGDLRWRVHPGGETGFSATATEWTLPAGYTPNAFTQPTAQPACGAAGTPSYFVGDATGDGQVDLIVTRVCGDDHVGDTVWRVHAGGASGFAAAADHALPAGYVPAAFTAPAATRACGAPATPTHVTIDADGDGALDLVVTRVCGDDAVGDQLWRAHRGGPGGFGAAVELGLPAGYPAASFRAIAAEPACGAAGTPSYLARDVDGDGALDLVVTRVCGDDDVGTSRWRVHAGSDAGFGAEQSIPLPGGYVARSFESPAATRACGADDTPSHVLVELDADARPDLLVTRLCGDATVGDTRWLVHRSECQE